MALKKKFPGSQEKSLTDLRDDINHETIPKIDENSINELMKPEKKKFQFINKDKHPKEDIPITIDKVENLQNIEEEISTIAEEISKIAKNTMDFKENSEETKISQEGEYNPELIKTNFFLKKEENQLDNLSNDYWNSSEKNNSHPEDPSYSENNLKEEVVEKPNEKKMGFKFVFKGKNSDKKEVKNENENIENQIKSIKDLDELKDSDSKKEGINDTLSISNSDKITYSAPLRDSVRSMEDKGFFKA